MTKELRWRIISLQAILVIVLAFVAAIGFSLGTFVNGTVHDQLSAQQISFPGPQTRVAGGALDPATFPKLQAYAGRQVDDGDTAYAYATYFMGEHLTKIYVDPATGRGLTYAQVSAIAMKDPTNTKAAGAKAALFQGEMLRTSLLNAWGWSQTAMYTTYASIGLLFASLLVLCALIFEVAFAPRPAAIRRQEVKTGVVPA